MNNNEINKQLRPYRRFNLTIIQLMLVIALAGVLLAWYFY